MTMTVLVLFGSLRAASISTQIAALAPRAAPAGVTVQNAEGLDALPFYNQDLDTAEPPPPVARLRAQVGAADAVLFVTPANNGSVSAVLKNAIDWLSRPREIAALHDKPAALIVAGWSPATAETHLEQILRVAGATIVSTSDRQINLKTLRGHHPAEEPAVHTAIAGALTALADEAERSRTTSRTDRVIVPSPTQSPAATASGVRGRTGRRPAL